jgi:O-Antigen ligase
VTRRWGRRIVVPTVFLDGAPAFAGVAAAVVWLGFSSGGYYATTSGPATAIAAGLACAVLACGRGLVLGRGDWIFVSSLFGFVLWIGVASLRPGAATRGVPELERGALYVAAAWTLLTALRRPDVTAALAGAFAGTVAVTCAGLVSLLLSQHVTADAYEGRLLFEPVGYANACGVLAGLGCVLGLGAIAHAASPLVRAAAAGGLVPLVVGLYLTGSRGAEAAALLGLAAAVVLDPGRRWLAAALLFSTPLPMLGVGLAARSRVGDPQASSELIARNGRIVFVLVVLLALAQACAVPRAVSRLAPSFGRWAPRALLVLAGAAGLATALHVPVAVLGDRPAYWRVALADVHEHPWLGSGPGTFAVRWLMGRPEPVVVQNAHNLYLETLAELGPVGLALLVAALAVPVVCAVRRRSAVAAVACGAYVTVLAHAWVDWDWQMPAVTTAALVCGAAILVETRRDGGAPLRGRLILASASALIMLAASLEAAGNSALASAAGGGPHAATAARTAERWQPWSAEPLQLLGHAYLAAGDRARALHAFKEAAGREPDAWATWYELARLGDRRAVTHIVRLNPLAVRRLSG